MPDNANGLTATILNADADEAGRFAVTQLLRKAGFRVREATTEADVAGAAGGADLILLGPRLSDAGAVEACRRLKAVPATAPIPVLLLAPGCQDSRYRLAAFEAGAEACLAPSAPAEELVAQITTLVRLRRAERQARDRAEELERLLEVLPVGVGIAHDPGCHCITHNAYLSDLLGVPVWQNASLSAPPGERPESYKVCREGNELPPGELPMQVACTGIEVRDFEVDLVRAGRDARRLLCSARPLLDAAGNIRGSVGGFLDVTDREATGRALRESERRFKTLAGSAPVGIFEADAQGNCVFVNDRWCRMAGMTPEAARGRGWAEALHPEDHDRIFREWYAAAQEGQEFASEYRFRTPQGRVTWLSGSAVALRDEVGTITGYIGTVTDITGLKDADRRKDEFIATLAHELRNPLAPIRNAVQVLKAKGLPDPDLAWSREVIDRQVTQMARLLDDLLDVSRIGRNRVELRKERVELAAVVAGAVETSRPLLEAGEHELTVVLPPEPVYVDADATRLAQVFSNLLNNAAKYTNRGGRIGLDAQRIGPEVIVAVKDTGMGIAPDVLPRLFQMFSQARPALERSQGGLGIGLSLVKGLVEMHGGTVEAKSDGPGRGSEFVVRLPAAPPPQAKPQSPPGGGHPPAAGCKIVVADDNRDAVDSLALMLRIMGHEVRTAGDGQEALEVAEAFQPGVVLLDIGMPRVDGYEACRRIRGQPWGKGVLIVALTGWGQEEDRRRSQEAGFDAHLVKPANCAALERLLAGLRPATP